MANRIEITICHPVLGVTDDLYLITGHSGYSRYSTAARRMQVKAAVMAVKETPNELITSIESRR